MWKCGREMRQMSGRMQLDEHVSAHQQAMSVEELEAQVNSRCILAFLTDWQLSPLASSLCEGRHGLLRFVLCMDQGSSPTS